MISLLRPAIAVVGVFTLLLGLAAPLALTGIAGAALPHQAGGSLVRRGGQVIGATSNSGTEVTDRPVTIPDLFRSVYHTLKIDPDFENMSGGGRPIKIVDGGEVVSELFS